VFVISLRLWLWLRRKCEHKQSHEVKKNRKTVQNQEERKLAKPSRPKNRETNNRVCVVFATFSAFCNVNLRWGDRTFHFALYLRHLEDRPFHVTWCLQDFANDMCSVFEFQPSILHGKFPFWLILEALCNLVNQLIYIMVFTPTQGNKRGQKRNNWRGAWGGGRSASRKERRTKLRLCSSFAVVVVLVFHGSCCSPPAR
jgi:hypothetical protein